MNSPLKKRALAPRYVSPKQLALDGFETPFEQTLNSKNRWAVLALYYSLKMIPLGKQKKRQTFPFIPHDLKNHFSNMIFPR
jgi:hypothetical protein